MDVLLVTCAATDKEFSTGLQVEEKSLRDLLELEVAPIALLIELGQCHVAASPKIRRLEDNDDRTRQVHLHGEGAF